MSKEDIVSEVILTPIYEETVYKYHKCSGCNKKIYLEESFLTPFYFKEIINYCPFCGFKIIRYAKPQFEKSINWDWMDKFKKMFNNLEKKIEYELFVNMSENERKEIITKSKIGEVYFPNLSWNCNSQICKILKETASKELHYSYLKRLKDGKL